MMFVPNINLHNLRIPHLRNKQWITYPISVSHSTFGGNIIPLKFFVLSDRFPNFPFYSIVILILSQISVSYFITVYYSVSKIGCIHANGLSCFFNRYKLLNYFIFNRIYFTNCPSFSLFIS